MKTDQALQDWVNRRVTPDMRKTAEEWYDGLNSAMYRLWASAFRDDVEMRWADYKDLASEASEALARLSPSLEKWRPRLEELERLAADALHVKFLLDRMKIDAKTLINLGIYDQEINGVVQEAAYVARDARHKKSVAQSFA